MPRIRRLIAPAPAPTARALVASLLALVALLGACASNPLLHRARGGSLASYQQVCLSAQVATGHYEIPAFNQASVRAMTRSADAFALELAGACDATDLWLDYRMTFDARSPSWSAEMSAVTAAGQVLWQGHEAAAIPSHGAFQYLSESNAERLLARFIKARSGS